MSPSAIKLLAIGLTALVGSSAANGFNQAQLFHGTSIVVKPDYEDRQASNLTAFAANFYCYFGVTGYLSFGW